MKNKILRVRKSQLQDQGKEKDLVGVTPAERFAMVHVLTKNAWAFRGVDIDKQRLQRHIVRVRRLGG